MKPEPSELVLRGCMSLPRSPPLGLPPPRRFLKKSSKNSSNGEPGGNCGVAPRSPPPLASTVCEVEILTTASITFSAMSAIPSGPRAKAGTAASMVTAPSETAAPIRRRRRLKAGLAPVMSASLQRVDLGTTVRPNGSGAQAFAPGISAKNRSQKLTIALIGHQLFRHGRVCAETALAPDQPDQNQTCDRRSDAHRTQDMVRRRDRALHRPPHPGRARREHDAFKHEQ